MEPQSPNEEATSSITPKRPSIFKSKLFLIVAGLVVIAIITVIIAVITTSKDEPKVATTNNVVVVITDDAFSPQTVKISKNSTVTWVNNGTTGKRIAAEPYPTGDSLPGLDSEELIAPGESYIFPFEEAGTYNYYEYSNPTIFKGTVIVE